MDSIQDSFNRGIFGDMAKLLEHLPHYQGPTELILLKGHLLIEELLRFYIARKLPNPSAFEHNQFSFSKVLIICRSLTPLTEESWGFDAAKYLNDARNEIAHKINSPKTQIKLENFINFVERHSMDSVSPPQNRKEACLYMAITDLHHELSHVLRADEK